MLDDARWIELKDVNRRVNRSIVAKREHGGVLDEQWLISPKAGNCHDYAVTKRHELLARGWPSGSLLLAEAVVPGGEYHLTLIVRTDDGDFVLDNLDPNIRPWSQTRYRWLRIQSPTNPRFWATIEAGSVLMRGVQDLLIGEQPDDDGGDDRQKSVAGEENQQGKAPSLSHLARY